MQAQELTPSCKERQRSASLHGLEGAAGAKKHHTNEDTADRYVRYTVEAV